VPDVHVKSFREAGDVLIGLPWKLTALFAILDAIRISTLWVVEEVFPFSQGSFPAKLNRPPDLVVLIAGCTTRSAHPWCSVLPGWVSQPLLADLVAEHIYSKKDRQTYPPNE
jgi:hypothetical protein